MFVPEGHDKTFGEVDAGWKHSISHRAVAFEKLLKRVGNDRARRLMELAVAVKPKVAIEALEKMVPSGSGKPS